MRALGKLPVSSAAVPGQGRLQQLPPGPELCWPFTPGTCWVPAETPEHCRGGMAAFQQLQSGSPQAVPGFGWVCAGLQPPPGHWGQASPWHRAAVLFPRALHSVLGLGKRTTSKTPLQSLSHQPEFSGHHSCTDSWLLQACPGHPAPAMPSPG